MTATETYYLNKIKELEAKVARVQRAIDEFIGTDKLHDSYWMEIPSYFQEALDNTGRWKEDQS